MVRPQPAGFTFNCWNSPPPHRFCNRFTPCLIKDVSTGIRYVSQKVYFQTANGSTSLVNALGLPPGESMVLRITGPLGDGFWARALILLAHSWWAERVGVPIEVKYASRLDTYFDSSFWRCSNRSFECSQLSSQVRDGFSQYFQPIHADKSAGSGRSTLLQLDCLAAARVYEQQASVTRDSFDAAGQQRAHRAAAVARLLRPRRKFERAADSFWSAHFVPGQKVLGVHLRGTDKIQTIDGPSRYMLLIRAFLCKYEHAAVFVATDDERMLSRVRMLIRNVSSHTQVAFTNATRSHSALNAGVHATHPAYLMNYTADPPSKLGSDSLLDTLLLARADFLLKSFSTVSEMAIYFNLRLHNNSFDFDLDRSARKRGNPRHPKPAWSGACRVKKSSAEVACDRQVESSVIDCAYT